MYDNITIDMKVINPTDILQYEEGSQEKETLVKTFEATMKDMKEEMNPRKT